MVKRQIKQNHIYRAALYASILGLMGLSWYFGALNGSQANSYSLKLTNSLMSSFELVPVYITSFDAAYWVVSRIIHLLEYGLMGIILCAMLNCISKKAGLSALVTLAVMSVWAALDELNKSMVGDRYSRWLDVGLDISGVIIAIFLVSVFVYIRKLRIQNISLMHEVHLLNINSKLWDNLIPRLAGDMDESKENSFDAPLLVQREVVEGGC